jgi:hypothetical protein
MSLPGMGEDGAKAAARRSDYDYIAKDIAKPDRKAQPGVDARLAVALQLAFGYAGGGYFYLGERRKGVLSVALSVLCGCVVVGLEMMVFPSATVFNESLLWVHYVAVAVFAVWVCAYFASVYECYRTALRLRKIGRGRGGWVPDGPREPTPQERVESVFREHDRRSGV